MIPSALTLSQTTNFRLFQTETVCRQQFQTDENSMKFSKREENTMGKSKLLVTSKGLFRKGLTLYQTLKFSIVPN